MSRLVLITGADGYLGLRTAQRLLADTDDRLVLTVRAADRAELTGKEERLLAALGAGAGRAAVHPADLTEDAPLTELTRDVGVIVHAAARTAFDQSRQDAQRINVDGSLRVARYADQCPRLERFVLLSTLVSVGRRTGEVPEAALSSAAGFANHYEWSKSEAERQVAERHPALPLSIARLSTIVADDDTGNVTQYNAFHNTLRLFFYGLITVVPGLPDTRLYLATAAATSAALVHLTHADTPTGVYHLAPAPEQAVRLGDAIDTAFEVFETDSTFMRRRLLRPQYCDLETFRHLTSAAQTLRTSPSAAALRSVLPFAEQLFCPKEFDNSRLVRSWPRSSAFGSEQLVHSVCRSLVRGRWGRNTPGATSTAAMEATPCP